MSKKSRKTYKKPLINQVKLVVDEAILAGCKIQTDPAEITRHCNFKDCVTSGS